MGTRAGLGFASPPHMVTLSDYCIDVSLVTVSAFRRYVRAGMPAPPATVTYPGGTVAVGGTPQTPTVGTGPAPGNQCTWTTAAGATEANPISCLTFATAAGYCAWVGERLVTEAEWEFAATNRGTTAWPWGSATPSSQLCWSGGGTRQLATCVAGAFPSGNTAAGVQDMLGNVVTWTVDLWMFGYDPAPVVDPVGPAVSPDGSGFRRTRGQGYADTSLAVIQNNRGGGVDPTLMASALGFRCVRRVGP